jgi:hypothetical protein
MAPSRVETIEAALKSETTPTGDVLVQPTIKFGFGKSAGTEKRSQLFDAGLEIRDELVRIAELSNIRIWILLDRLDEIFLRRTDTETRALRALLRASYRFSNQRTRVKLFLREDIFETLATDGFTALTHVTDRSSDAMSWNSKDLLRLVTKRLAAMKYISGFFHFDVKQVDTNPEYQHRVFYQVFPPKVGKQPTFEWLIASLRDGKDQVTPRDLIDLINHARNNQLKKFRLEKKQQNYLIEEQALKDALASLSENKRDRYLFAEQAYACDSSRSPDDAICRRRHGAEAQDVVAT